jgi:hypothetical protein
MAFIAALQHMKSLERLGIARVPPPKTYGDRSQIQRQILEILRKLDKPLRSLDASKWSFDSEDSDGLPGLVNLSIPNMWFKRFAREHSP